LASARRRDTTLVSVARAGADGGESGGRTDAIVKKPRMNIFKYWNDFSTGWQHLLPLSRPWPCAAPEGIWWVICAFWEQNLVFIALVRSPADQIPTVAGPPDPTVGRFPGDC
jgi:hypothetical protein